MNLTTALDSLRSAITHADALGIDIAPATATLEAAEQRDGFAGDTFVLALVGGTGVGKSTFLNALAGTTVSEASVLRPTTATPVAWIEESASADLEPLLEWLEVTETVTHGGDTLSHVAIIDLPDIDSIIGDHRLTVDRLLPKVDSVAWLVDPQKYDDERLYEYLRAISGRADRVRVILNKADQLDDGDVRSVTDDLERRLASANIGCSVTSVSARTGAGIDGFVHSLADEADAKAVVVRKLHADALAAAERLAAQAGVNDRDYAPLVDDASVTRYLDEASHAAVDLIDPQGVAGHTKSAYLDAAASKAGSIFGRLGLVARIVFGARRTSSNPHHFLVTWRQRGDLSRVVNPVRRIYLEAGGNLAADARAHLLGHVEPANLKNSLEDALDRAAQATSRGISITSRWLWRVLAVLQLVATVAFIGAAAWYLLLIFGPRDLPVGAVEVPVIGPVPTPLAVLIGSLALSLVVGGIVRIHAAIVGAREGRRAADRTRDEVETALVEHALGPLREIEGHRRAIAEARNALRSGIP